MIAIFTESKSMNVNSYLILINGRRKLLQKGVFDIDVFKKQSKNKDTNIDKSRQTFTQFFVVHHTSMLLKKHVANLGF